MLKITDNNDIVTRYNIIAINKFNGAYENILSNLQTMKNVFNTTFPDITSYLSKRFAEIPLLSANQEFDVHVKLDYDKVCEQWVYSLYVHNFEEPLFTTTDMKIYLNLFDKDSANVLKEFQERFKHEARETINTKTFMNKKKINKTTILYNVQNKFNELANEYGFICEKEEQ